MFAALLFALVASSTGQNPKFDVPYQNVTLESGIKHYLNCKAEGDKPITYKWYNQKGNRITTKDDKQPVYVRSLESFFDSDLFFKRLSTKHEGSYTCTASNAHGLASKVFFIRVPPPSGLKPQFDFPSESVTMEPGLKRYLRCKADGEKPIAYKWYNQDGYEVKSDQNKPFYVTNLELFSDLDFKRLSPEHEGSYKCIASNANGQSTKLFFLRVLPPSGMKPKFNLSYEMVTLDSGTKQYLRCRSEGEKPITYKWYNQDGEEIKSGSQNPVYVTNLEDFSDLDFKRLSHQHEGSYRCMASNVNGQAYKVFILRVSPHSGQNPKFDVPYQNVTLESGMKQYMNCKAEGDKPITYKWYNQKGKQITTKDDKQPVYIRSLASFFDSDLFFKRPSSEHEGLYTCTARNMHGLASKVFEVTVSPPSGLKPEFDFPSENLTMVPSLKRYLRCQAEGEKPITYKWYNQDGDEIKSDSKKPVYVTNLELFSDLDFKPLSPEHEGSYKCIASNVNGQATKVFFLTVPPPIGPKPKFNLPYKSLTLEPGMKQKLRCQAAGEKPILYKWYNQDGDEIMNDPQNPVYVTNLDVFSDLEFNSLSPEHEGFYKCTASNDYGEANKVFFMRVSPPSDGNDTDIDQGKGMSRFLDAKVLKYTARSVTFNIITSGPFKYIEIKYWEGKRESNATSIRFDSVPGNIYEIGNLLLRGLYSFQFRIVPPESNDWSREYNIMLPDVQDLPDAPQITLQHIGDRSVKLQWLTKTDDLLRGTIDKYQIKYFTVGAMGGDNSTSKTCSATFEVLACVGSPYTILQLERTIFYQMEVRAHNEAGYSEPWRQRIYLP